MPPDHPRHAGSRFCFSNRRGKQAEQCRINFRSLAAGVKAKLPLLKSLFAEKILRNRLSYFRAWETAPEYWPERLKIAAAYGRKIRGRKPPPDSAVPPRRLIPDWKITDYRLAVKRAVQHGYQRRRKYHSGKANRPDLRTMRSADYRPANAAAKHNSHCHYQHMLLGYGHTM